MAPKLIVEVLGDVSGLQKSLGAASDESKGLGSRLGSLSVGFGQLAKGFVEIELLQKAFQGLDDAVHLGIEGFSDTTRVAAQTAAVIKSTGDASNLSAKQVHALAASLSNVSGIDDEVIQSAENVLLSFTQIRDFAGKNNDIFTRATKVVTDYASRTGKSATTAATIIGRALADPATKAVALSRAGIVLTKSQLEALKAIEKTSGVVAAQKVLLGDLETRYQGAAAAAGKTLPGQLNILRERFKDLAGEVVGDVTPGLKGFVTALTATVVKITQTSGFRAKLSVLWTGVQEAGAGAEAALRRAVGKVDWTKVWAGASGIADGLASRLKSVNWSAVGASIGDGIAKSISVAASATKAIAQKLENIFKAINFVALGKAIGPGLAAALVTAFTTLTDPTFWIKNWQLALAVASVAFGDGLGRIGLKLAEPFTRLGARLAGDFGLTIAGGIEKVAPRLAEAISGALGKAADSIERVAPNIGRPIIRALDALSVAAVKAGEDIAGGVLSGLLKLPGLAGTALDKLTAPFRRAFARLGGLTQLVIKIAGAQAAIAEVTKTVSRIAGLFSRIAGTVAHALDGAWKALENGAVEAATKTALKVVEPFAHLPDLLGGGKFKALQAKLEGELQAMQNPAFTAGKNVGDSVVAGINAGLQGPIGTPTLPVPPGLAGPTATPPKPIGSRNASAGFSPTLPAVPPAPKNAGLSATQKNTFFDNAISSDLTRAGFITNIKQQIGALQTIAGLISARIAATKDVTRRRTLEDQLLGVESQITGDRQQIAQDFLSSLQFGITKAQATATFKDDIAAITKLEDGIKAQIKATGDTLDLEQQLFDAQQQLVTARNSQRNAVQFKALGLTATGDDVTPGVKKLKSELSTLTGAITGTFLDTSKTQSILSQLTKVLSGGLGVVGQQVRQKVQSIIDGLNQQLKGNAANLSKFQHVSTSALLAGLGLSPDLEKELRSRISQLGPNGTIPAGQTKAFALAGASAPSGSGGLSINGGTFHFHGVDDPKKMEAALIKIKKRRAPRRTGPN